MLDKYNISNPAFVRNLLVLPLPIETQGTLLRLWFTPFLHPSNFWWNDISRPGITRNTVTTEDTYIDTLHAKTVGWLETAFYWVSWDYITDYEETIDGMTHCHAIMMPLTAHICESQIWRNSPQSTMNDHGQQNIVKCHGQTWQFMVDHD